MQQDRNKKKKNRQYWGILAGYVGIFSNFVLFLIKIISGIIMHSVSIMADSFNNLSDAASSLVTIIGFKISSKPADDDHPFGHGRMEYISSLIISFMIFLLAYEFIILSVKKIIYRQPLEFHAFTLFFLIIAVLIKILQFAFYRHLYQKTNSLNLKALAKDSRNDIVISTLTIISLVLFHYANILIDGYLGLGISFLLLYTGYEIAKETISSLLGEAIDMQMAEKIKTIVMEYDYVIGIHDLIVHNYGPNQFMATLHAEVPDHVKLNDLHEIIDEAEMRVLEELNIALVIHMDPISLDNPKIKMLSKLVQNIIHTFDDKLDAHDFRLVQAKTANFIFDIEIPRAYPNEKKISLVKIIKSELKIIDPMIKCIINFDYSFVQSNNKKK